MDDKTKSKGSYAFSLVMLCLLFFVFGLVSWVNSILVPYFKVACELQSEVQSYLAQFAFYIAYLVMTIPASILLNRTGYKRGALIGLWILAAGAFLFVPAAFSRTYNLFLLALFVMGTALAILQTVANPFVTIIGPIESAARRISLVGICNKLAGILSPIIFSALVIRPSDKITMALVQSGELTGEAKSAALDELIKGVIPPYLVLGILLVIFGIVFYKSRIQDINPSENASNEPAGGRKSVLSYPYLVLGVLALFCHLGAQALSVNTIVGFADSLGFGSSYIFPSMTLACTLLGYLLGVVLIPKVISQQNMLKVVTSIGLILSILVVTLPAKAAIWCLVLLGIPNSVIYAGIWPLAIHDLGKWTNLGSAILVMALCGSAILPLVYARCVDVSGSLQASYWLLIPCFVYMIFYALWGYRIKYWGKKKA